MELSQPINVNSVSIEHAPRELLLNGGISALKDFIVIGEYVFSFCCSRSQIVFHTYSKVCFTQERECTSRSGKLVFFLFRIFVYFIARVLMCFLLVFVFVSFCFRFVSSLLCGVVLCCFFCFLPFRFVAVFFIGFFSFGLVWFGLVWFGLVWTGLNWFGLVRFGLIWVGGVGLVWFGLGWVVLVWTGLNWFRLVWFGLGWFGLAWVGLVWFVLFCSVFPFLR